MEATDTSIEETEFDEAVRRFRSFARKFEERLEFPNFSEDVATTVTSAANTGTPKIKFIGAGSAGIVIKIEGYRRRDVVLKIVFAGKWSFLPRVVKWEPMIGAWFTSDLPDSYSGPSIPIGRNGTVLSKTRATKLLNVLGHKRAAYLPERQAFAIGDALATMEELDTLIGYEPSIDRTIFYRNYERISKAPLHKKGPYGLIFEVEEADMGLDHFLAGKRSYGSLARSIQSATIQILMTYEELNKRYTWVHGDLGTANVFVAGIDATSPQELTYEGSGGHVLRVAEDRDKGQFILYLIGDMGFSFFEGRDFLQIRGVETPKEWHSLLANQSFAADLHHFAIDSIYDIVGATVVFRDASYPTPEEEKSVVDSLHMLSTILFREEDLVDELSTWVQRKGRVVNYKKRIRSIREAVESMRDIDTGVLSFAGIFGTRADPAGDIMDFRYLPDEAVVDAIARRRDLSDLWAHGSFDPYRV